jgi:hypothetical protein
MNWYKESQRIYEQDTHENNYLDIGHGKDWATDIGYSENEESSFVAWIWDGHNILTGTGHSSIQLERQEEMYHGRYEKTSRGKKVSIIIPQDKQFFDIPNYLVKALNRKFGDDTNIYLFDQ